ncbi:MAG: sel1 repeat family protein [Bacteroidales bacterium]|nr:sel1 repeat family protein [Bacteroidales bacterium]
MKSFIRLVIHTLLKIFKQVWRVIKKIKKVLLAILVLIILVWLSIIGYDKYDHMLYKRFYNAKLEHVEHLLNDFSNPDSVFAAADVVLRNKVIRYRSYSFSISDWDYWRNHPNEGYDTGFTLHDKAIESLERIAEGGYYRASFMLGLWYAGYSFRNQAFTIESGRNMEKAAYWYLQAANQGHADAMSLLGQMFFKGVGVSKDLEKAVYWYKESTKYGGADAALLLGDCFRDGVKIEIGSHEKTVYRHGYFWDYVTVTDYKTVIIQNMDSAFYYWKLADKRGCEDAKDRLQKIYN